MSESKGGGEKLIASNPSARADFFLDEFVEAGIVLEEIGRNLTPSPFLTSSVLAATALLAPGMGTARRPAWRTAATKAAPGSEMAGVPASLT